jgi:hypothetical protein
MPAAMLFHATAEAILARGLFCAAVKLCDN